LVDAYIEEYQARGICAASVRRGRSATDRAASESLAGRFESERLEHKLEHKLAKSRNTRAKMKDSTKCKFLSPHWSGIELAAQLPHPRKARGVHDAPELTPAQIDAHELRDRGNVRPRIARERLVRQEQYVLSIPHPLSFSNSSFERPVMMKSSQYLTNRTRNRSMASQAFIEETRDLVDWVRTQDLHDRTITVTACGRICIGRRKVNLSHVFAGQKVGIKELDEKIWLVTFMQYDLGFFDEEYGRVERAENPFGAKVLSPMCRPICSLFGR
jgi:hypothetical protein